MRARANGTNVNGDHEQELRLNSEVHGMALHGTVVEVGFGEVRWIRDSTGLAVVYVVVYRARLHCLHHTLGCDDYFTSPPDQHLDQH